MTIAADRLKPFTPRALPSRKSHEPSNHKTVDCRMLDAAQDAGVSIKMMRKAVKWSVGYLADVLGMTTADLRKAEAGQLVFRGEDGQLIDFPAALLILVARATEQKSIPLP